MQSPETLAPGAEQYEFYTGPGRMGKRGPRLCQYDYRHPDGSLFSCVAKTLAECRTRRDDWAVRRKMSDADYAEKREDGLDICPSCQSRTVTATGSLEWSTDGDLATHPLECEDCGFKYTEILRPVGYEPG